MAVTHCCFQGSPEPAVTWLKDGLPLPSQAVVSTEDGSTQLLLRATEFSDSGTYTVELGDELGKKETFSFQVQIAGNSLPSIQIYQQLPVNRGWGMKGLRAALGEGFGCAGG